MSQSRYKTPRPPPGPRFWLLETKADEESMEEGVAAPISYVIRIDGNGVTVASFFSLGLR
jgi:hypothetical protein